MQAKSIKLVFASVSLAALLAACGSARDAGSTSTLAATSVLAQSSSAEAIVTRPTSAALPAGDYLVRFARTGCSVNELFFSKHYTYVAVATGAKAYVSFTEAGIVDDGLAHPAVCALGSVSSGAVRVKMSTPFTLDAVSTDGKLKIDAVFKYQTLPVVAGEGSLLGRGTYVVDFAAAMPCASHELVFAKSIRDLGMGIENAIFRPNGRATDNLPQTLQCQMDPPPSQGSAVLRATAPSTKLSVATIYYGGPVPVTTGGAWMTVKAIRMVTGLTRVL